MGYCTARLSYVNRTRSLSHISRHSPWQQGKWVEARGSLTHFPSLLVLRTLSSPGPRESWRSRVAILYIPTGMGPPALARTPKFTKVTKSENPKSQVTKVFHEVTKVVIKT